MHTNSMVVFVGDFAKCFQPLVYSEILESQNFQYLFFAVKQNTQFKYYFDFSGYFIILTCFKLLCFMSYTCMYYVELL